MPCGPLRAQDSGIFWDNHGAAVDAAGVTFTVAEYWQLLSRRLLAVDIGGEQGRGDLLIDLSKVRDLHHPLLVSAAADKKPIVQRSPITLGPVKMAAAVSKFKNTVMLPEYERPVDPNTVPVEPPRSFCNADGVFDVITYAQWVNAATMGMMTKVTKVLEVPVGYANREELQTFLHTVAESCTLCYHKEFPQYRAGFTHGHNLVKCLCGLIVRCNAQVAPENPNENAWLFTSLKHPPGVMMSDCVCTCLKPMTQGLRAAGVIDDGRHFGVRFEEDIRTHAHPKISVPGILPGTEVPDIALPSDVATHSLPDCPTHPRTQLKCCFLLHDDMHGSKHKSPACQNRRVELILQLKHVATTVDERVNNSCTYVYWSSFALCAVMTCMCLQSRKNTTRARTSCHSPKRSCLWQYGSSTTMKP